MNVIKQGKISNYVSRSQNSPEKKEKQVRTTTIIIMMIKTKEKKIYIFLTEINSQY